MYSRTCGRFKSAKKAWARKSEVYKLHVRKSQKDWVLKSAKCHISGRSANLTNYLSRGSSFVGYLVFLSWEDLLFWVINLLQLTRGSVLTFEPRRTHQ